MQPMGHAKYTSLVDPKTLGEYEVGLGRIIIQKHMCQIGLERERDLRSFD